MKRRRIVIFLLVGAVIVAAALFLALKSNAAPEQTAEAILKKSYNATPEDYDNLTSAISVGRKNYDNLSGAIGVIQEDDTALLSYLQTFYDSGISENCLKDICRNRIPFRAEKIAHDENSNIKVTSIKLEPTGAVPGSKSFNYIVQIQSTKDEAKIFTFKGAIKLIQESGHWKADAMT